MINIRPLFQEIMQEALNAGLPVPVSLIEPRLKYNNAVTRLGSCSKDNRTGRYQITLSRLILKDDAVVKNTLMHELIHTLPGCMNHGKQFQHYAHIVNDRYGYTISRTASVDDCASVNLADEQKARANYHFKCKNCGAEVHRQRSSRFTMHPEHYRCGKCGGNKWTLM